MDQEQYQLAKIIIKHELEVIRQFQNDELNLAKYLYMFWTGIEITTNDGKVHEVYPLGPFRGWLIEAMNQEKNPYKKSSENINPIKKMRFTGKNVTSLLQQAEIDPVAWDAAKTLAFNIFKQGEDLPKELNEFLIKTLNRPIKKRGPSKLKNFHRNTCIVILISELKRVGIFHPTKSSSYSEKLSICDAIVEVFHDSGTPIEYDTVKSAWNMAKKDQNHLSSYRLDIK